MLLPRPLVHQRTDPGHGQFRENLELPRILTECRRPDGQLRSPGYGLRIPSSYCQFPSNCAAAGEYSSFCGLGPELSTARYLWTLS